jgi:hypothetical protein
MWRSVGVVGLWVALIATPHLRGVQTVTAADVPPVPAVPAEDPGEPFDSKADEPQRAMAGSFATVRFKNQLGKGVALTEVLFTFDGKPLPTIEAVKPDQDVVIFSGKLSTGMHLMRTEMHLQGARRGPITYTQSYKFKVTAEQVLTVPENKTVVYTIAGTRNKGMNVPFDRQYNIQMTTQETAPVTSSLTN